MRTILWLKLRLLRREYMIMVVMTAMALILTAIFSGSMGGNYQPTILLVAEEDNQELDRFASLISKSNTFAFEFAEEDDAFHRVESELAMAAIVIPAGFDEQIQSGEMPVLSIYQAKDALEVMELQNWIRATVYRMQSDQRMLNFSDEYFQSPEARERILEEADVNWVRRVPVEVTSQTVSAGFFDGYDLTVHYLVGFLLFFSTFSIVFTMGDLLQEKKQFTWHRQMISPLSKQKILAGNILYAWAIGVGQVLVLVGAGGFLFGIDWKAPLAVLGILAVYILAIAGLGMLITGFVRTIEQLSAITPMILVAFAMLGGCMWPLEIISNRFLLFAANLTPHKWALQAIERIVMFDAGVETIGTPILILGMMSLVFFILGLWRFHKHAM